MIQNGLRLQVVNSAFRSAPSPRRSLGAGAEAADPGAGAASGGEGGAGGSERRSSPGGLGYHE